jgi:hypothetical protein
LPCTCKEAGAFWGEDCILGLPFHGLLQWDMALCGSGSHCFQLLRRRFSAKGSLKKSVILNNFVTLAWSFYPSASAANSSGYPSKRIAHALSFGNGCKIRS